MSKSELEVQVWFIDLIHDQKYVTARWAKRYSEITGIEVETLVKGTIIFLLGLLIVLKQPHYLANGLLVIVPIILTYLEPSERPSTGIMFIYWTLFGFFVVFDRVLEYIPLYYAFKLAGFVALFLPPSNPTIELIHKKINYIPEK
uniref:Receptor expression-enhancing protein n=1 Tax=Caenorhabditis tropicalis TaxID=1561998 RepID=A0A1I7TD24_9PELO